MVDMIYPRISRHTGFTPRDRSTCIICATAIRHGVTFSDVVSRDRHKRIVNARDDVCQRLRDTGRRVGQIAEILHRDRTTIAHSLRKMVPHDRQLNVIEPDDQGIENKQECQKNGDNYSVLVEAPETGLNKKGCQQLEAAA